MRTDLNRHRESGNLLCYRYTTHANLVHSGRVELPNCRLSIDCFTPHKAASGWRPESELPRQFLLTEQEVFSLTYPAQNLVGDEGVEPS